MSHTDFSGSISLAYLELIPGMAWWYNASENQLYLNEKSKQFLGVHSPLQLEDFLSLLHPNDKSPIQSLRNDLQHKEITATYRIRNNTGHYRLVQESVKAVESDKKEQLYFCICQDIHAQHELEEKAERLSYIFNSSFQFFGLLSPEGKILEVNQPALDVNGLKKEEVLNEFFWDLAWVNYNENVQSRLKEAVYRAGKGEFVRYEETFLDLDNQHVIVDFSLMPVANTKGEVKYIIPEARDITRKKEAEEKIRESETKWRTLVTNTPDAIARLDTNLRYLYVNQVVEKQTSIPAEAFIGKTDVELGFPSKKVENYKRALLEAIQTKLQVKYTTLLSGSSEKQATILSSIITPEFNAKGEVTSLLVITRDITDLHYTQEALERAHTDLHLTNAKLFGIINGISDNIIAIDRDYKVIAFNEAAKEDLKKIFGNDLYLGMDVREPQNNEPDEHANSLQLWTRALRGESFIIRHEFGIYNRQRNYYEISFFPIYDAQGNFIGAAQYGRDISKERFIEKELKSAYEFLFLSENLPQIVFTSTPNGRIDYLNQTFFEYTGVSTNISVSNLNWEEFIVANDQEVVRQAWRTHVFSREEIGFQFEFRLKHKKDGYRWMLSKTVPLFSNNGQLIKWVGIMTDIHDSKMAELQQRQAAEELRQLAESLPQIVWTTNPNGEAYYFNHRWYDYTGENPLIVNATDWIKFIHPEDQGRTLEGWLKAVESKEKYQVEYRLQNYEGKYKWFLARGLPLKDIEGNVVKWFGTCTDIHRQKLQAKKLEEQNRRLNEINQYLDNFVHAAAHDLRAPVANLKGLISLLDFTPPENQKKVVDALKSSANRLDNTLKGMIELIEVQSSEQLPAKPIEIDSIFLEELRLFEEPLKQIKNRIDFDFSVCNKVIFIQPYLQSAFRNLISNAIKYRKLDQHLHINTFTEDRKDFCVIVFQDNGIGIDLEKFKKNLFRPFKRFTKQASGKGIGLHMVNNMFTKSGGKVEIESTLGEGTTIRLFISKDLNSKAN